MSNPPERSPLTREQLEASLVILRMRIQDIEAELMAHDVCCCGEMMEGHSGYPGTNHSPRSMADWAAEGTLTVSIEELRTIWWRRREIQNTPIEKIVWMEGGLPLTPTDPEAFVDFSFCGLSNLYFPEMYLNVDLEGSKG